MSDVDKVATCTAYTCALCKGTFLKAVSAGEAPAESRILFGGRPPKNLVLVCPDCFRELAEEQSREADRGGPPA